MPCRRWSDCQQKVERQAIFGLIRNLKTQPGQRDALLAHLFEAVPILREMEGCYLYVIAKAAEDPDAIWITEVWRSQADHQASLANEGIRAIINAARPLLAGPPEGFQVIPVGGKVVPGSVD